MTVDPSSDEVTCATLSKYHVSTSHANTSKYVNTVTKKKKKKKKKNTFKQKVNDPNLPQDDLASDPISLKVTTIKMTSGSIARTSPGLNA